LEAAMTDLVVVIIMVIAAAVWGLVIGFLFGRYNECQENQ